MSYEKKIKFFLLTSLTFVNFCNLMKIKILFDFIFKFLFVIKFNFFLYI